MPTTKETILEINLSHLEHNYNYLKALIKPETKFLGVVKAFAYGSDAVKVAIKLESLGIDYFAVAYTSEGVMLREAGIETPILVLHPQAVNFDLLTLHHLEPNLYSFRILKKFLDHAKQHRLKKYPIHLKFNTGLNRLGFAKEDITAIVKSITNRNEINVVSLLSHLAATEDVNEKEFTQSQIESFTKITNEFELIHGNVVLKHLLNTSGILNYSEAQFDMVRSGIGIYGFGNDAKFDKALKPIASLKTIISQRHTIKPGESVGYNRAYKAKKMQVTATLPLGHADGIGRHFGNGAGYVTIHGHKAEIVGNVCMDMIMVDVTGIECKEGDEVIIFGELNTAEMLAASSNTISYELLTGISQRVKRYFID